MVLQRTVATDAAVAWRQGWRRLINSLQPFLLLIPALGTLVAVSLYPVLQGFWLSFRDTSLSLPNDRFIGWRNYERILGDSLFWNAWENTVVFTVSSTLLETILGLLMALVVHETFRGRGLVRATMLLPWVVPTVVTSKMFGWLFDGQNGIINHLLVNAGFIQGYINWYGEPDYALWTIVIADVWKTTPFMALLLLAGLQTIPRDLQGAAAIDGAGPLRFLWYVRLPLLMPTLLIAAMFRALDAFRIFDLVFVLTGGGPADSTETLSTLIYKQLFSALQVGFGSALSTLMFATEAIIAVGFGVMIARKLRQTS